MCMVTLALCATLLAQNSYLKIWKGSPPRNEWPLFQGHRPVTPPKLSGIRCWVYSFPGQYIEVVTELRKRIGSRFTEFDPDTLEPRIYWDSFDRATEFTTGSVTVNYLIYDHSYTVLENCRVQNLESFNLIDDKTAKKVKGWITVIRNEPNPDVWAGDEQPHFKAGKGDQIQTAKGWSTEVKLPIPQQANWPEFYGNKPFAVWDGDIGNVRDWYYTFRANWDDVIKSTKNDLEKRGYSSDKKFNTPTEISFRRGMLNIISITLDDDSYSLYRDTRGADSVSVGRPSHGSASRGWVYVIRADPVSGMNLRFADRSDKEAAKSTPIRRAAFRRPFLLCRINQRSLTFLP